MIVTAKRIAEFLGVLPAGKLYREVSLVAKLLPGQEDALSFCKLDNSDSIKMLEDSLSSVIVCPGTLMVTISNLDKILKTKTLIPATNPRLSFAKVAQKFFPWRKVSVGTHPTAVVSPEAKISPLASIGPFSIISEGVEIGEDSVLYGHVTVYPNCKIGARVVIKSGTVIGGEGFGYVADEHGGRIQFPHIGRVVIEDDVEIGANTCIDRGALGDTLIKQGAKIDNLVHVAHNVTIGRNCCVICLVGIGGSVEIGDNSWIGISASIKNQKKIGKNVTVGMGAVVTKDIPDNETWIGNPAHPMVP